MVILIGFIFFGNTNTAVYMDATPVRRTDDVQTVLKGDNGGQSPVKRLEKRPMDTDTAPPFALKGNQGVRLRQKRNYHSPRYAKTLLELSYRFSDEQNNL